MNCSRQTDPIAWHVSFDSGKTYHLYKTDPEQATVGLPVIVVPQWYCIHCNQLHTHVQADEEPTE